LKEDLATMDPATVAGGLLKQ